MRASRDVIGHWLCRWLCSDLRGALLRLGSRFGAGMSRYSVAVYHVQQAYGGQEEGGWWYETGQPLDVAGTPRPLSTDSHKRAEAELKRQEEWINRAYPNQRPVWSTLSSGVYRSIMQEGPAVAFPVHRPHYE